MPTRLQNLTSNEWSRSHAPLAEEVVRRIHGDATHVETIQAIVEIDTTAAGLPAATGGLQQQPERVQIEQAARLEVAAAQEIFQADQFEISGRLWKVVGSPIGEDAGSKTIQLAEVIRVRGRQPNVNTR